MIPGNIRELIVKSVGYYLPPDEQVTVMDWLDNQPAVPEPDWDAAPEWAEWYMVAPDGTIIYIDGQTHEDMPTPVAEEGEWDWFWKCQYEEPGHVDLPLGIDWRTTLRRRPRRT